MRLLIAVFDHSLVHRIVLCKTSKLISALIHLPPNPCFAAIVVSAFFFVSLFFSPILASIPPYATGPALVLVGVLLIGHVDHIAWDDYLESIPAFLTIIMMPFTTSGEIDTPKTLNIIILLAALHAAWLRGQAVLQEEDQELHEEV